MHMADAYLSPAVGGVMWGITAVTAAYAGKKVQNELDERKVPLMGVLGAFIFAAQMINFAIPGTGSSGHLSGGLLLAVLLGPYAGFITMASILVIQAVFFADGGLLALGCNIFNMGFFPCLIGYPLIYKKIVADHSSTTRIFLGSTLTAVLSLQLGAFGAVLETFSSGILKLPFYTFTALMQLIHLAIGIGEGLITTAVVAYVRKARPEIMEKVNPAKPGGKISLKPILITFLVLAIFTGGVLSWFASKDPDGLEWALARTFGDKEPRTTTIVHQTLVTLRKITAFLPDYSFNHEKGNHQKENGLNVVANRETTTAGLIGAGLTLFLAGAIGFGLRVMKKLYQR